VERTEEFNIAYNFALPCK